MSKRYIDKMVPQRVVAEVRCDGCGKTTSDEEADGWYAFSSGHRGWGNDSIDSYDRHDVCSGACYLAVVRRLVEDKWPDEETLTVDDKDATFLRGLLASVPPRPLP